MYSQQKKHFKMGQDNNSWTKIWQRLKRGCGSCQFWFEPINIVINIWYMFLLNLRILWFNYFATLTVILL